MDQPARVTPATRPAPRGLAPTVAGLLVGIQSALLSWIVVAVPVIAAFTATSGLTYNSGVSWADAGRLGSDIWVLGHFGWMVLGEGATSAVVSLSPLGIALVSVMACAALTHSTTARGWPLVGGGVVGFLAIDAVIAFVFSRVAPSSGWMALVGGAAAAFAGLLWGNRPHGSELVGGRLRLLTDRVPPDVGAALRAGAALVAAVLALSAVLVAVAMVGGAARFRELFASLGVDAVGGVALALLCLALAPNALTWGVAYLCGAGFTVGEGTWFSPLQMTGGTEPALPLFGFLPTTEPASWAAAVVVAPVIAGCAAGWLVQRRLAATGAWWRPGFAALGAALVAAAALALLAVLASGAAGPGRMDQVGADWWPLFGWLALELGGGAAVGSWLLPRPWRDDEHMEEHR
jgi:hypothetical protein